MFLVQQTKTKIQRTFLIYHQLPLCQLFSSRKNTIKSKVVTKVEKYLIEFGAKATTLNVKTAHQRAIGEINAKMLSIFIFFYLQIISNWLLHRESHPAQSIKSRLLHYKALEQLNLQQKINRKLKKSIKNRLKFNFFFQNQVLGIFQLKHSCFGFVFAPANLSYLGFCFIFILYMKKSELKELIKEILKEILNEGMYDGARCPDCGGLLDDEGHHRKECPAKKRRKPNIHGGSDDVQARRRKYDILRKLIGKDETK